MPSNAELDAAQTAIVREVAARFDALRATNTTPTPEPEPAPEPPAPAPSVSGARAVATADNLVVFTAKVAGTTGTLTFRASASELTGQAGYPAQGTPAADGTLLLQIEDFNNTDPRFWQLEAGGTSTVYGAVLARGVVTQQEAPTAPPPAPGVGADPTGGAGGPLTDRVFQSYRNYTGITGQYHVYAAGLDWSKPVGALIYCDGTGDYGLQNPSSTYLLAGPSGLVATAKRHNMVLITPIPPGGKCDSASGTCWYQSSGPVTQEQKSTWSADLVRAIFAQYNIDRTRVAWGGYSSGAEWTSYQFTPFHADEFVTDGVGVCISYGGGGSWIRPTWGAQFKANVRMVWDVGGADTSALSAARSGEAWYRSQGFTTELNVVPGLGHGRAGQFGGLMDTYITSHVRPA